MAGRSKNDQSIFTSSGYQERKTLINYEEPFDPKKFISVGVTERDVEMYKEVFDMFDVQNYGSLTPNDLRNALEMFGFLPKKHLIYQIISDIDADESGGIDFREFLKIMTDQMRPCDGDTKEDYERVFSYFDFEGRGYIGKDDLRKIAVDLGENLSEEAIVEIFKICAPDDAETITFQNFYKYMKEAVSIKKKIGGGRKHK